MPAARSTARSSSIHWKDTGYQEILTDPSYHGQIVAMTYPLIGNYGVNAEDAESGKPWVRGFVIRESEPALVVSNFTASTDSLDSLPRPPQRHRHRGDRHPVALVRLTRSRAGGR